MTNTDETDVAQAVAERAREIRADLTVLLDVWSESDRELTTAFRREAASDLDGSHPRGVRELEVIDRMIRDLEITGAAYRALTTPSPAIREVAAKLCAQAPERGAP